MKMKSGIKNEKITIIIIIIFKLIKEFISIENKVILEKIKKKPNYINKKN